MPPVFWKSQVISFGSGVDGDYTVSGSFSFSGTKNYNNVTVNSGAILTIPRSANIKINGTLTNNGTITGGSVSTNADVAGTGSSYELLSADNLLPTSCNGANSTNDASWAGRGALRIVARFLVNNGYISTSGSTSTATDSSGMTSGVNGNGAGFIFILSQKITGSNSATSAITMVGGAGESGHGTWSYNYYHCDWYDGHDAYTTCIDTGGCGSFSTKLKNVDAQSAGWGPCGWKPGTGSAVGAGTAGLSSTARIITGEPTSGGVPPVTSSITTTISPFGAGSIIWFREKPSEKVIAVKKDN